MSNIPKIELNNGIEIPNFGLGTWQGEPGREEEVYEAVKAAIDLGYRLFDCANFYSNEKSIGKAFREKMDAGVIKREDIFIVSKLWSNNHRPDLVKPAIQKTLTDFQVDYIDLYLIHWPQAFQEGDCLIPKNPKSKKIEFSNVDYTSTWTAMEEVYRLNLTKAIGISNFNSKQIARLLEICTVVPQVNQDYTNSWRAIGEEYRLNMTKAVGILSFNSKKIARLSDIRVNQIECHPYLNQTKLRKYCKDKGIAVMAYCPLGGPRANVQPGAPDVLNDARIKEIATKYNKSPGQVLLRYNLQLGNVIIQKSANKNRLGENMGIFDFGLTSEDVDYINTFDCGGRVCRFEECKDHPDYPFNSEF